MEKIGGEVEAGGEVDRGGRGYVFALFRFGCVFWNISSNIFSIVSLERQRILSKGVKYYNIITIQELA